MSHRITFALSCSLLLLYGVVVGSPLLGQEATPAATPATATPAEPTYRLAYKFKKGDAVRYETVHKVKFVSQFNGTTETATNATETKKIYRVLDVSSDGSAELELIIEWVRMKLDNGDAVPIEFDTKDPGANTQAKFANVMKSVGKPQAHVHCAPNGKVLKVKDLTYVTPVAQGAQTIQLKDVALRDDFDFLTIFPADPIKIGQSWAEKSEIQVSAEDNKKLKEKVDLQRKYTLQSVAGDVATISFKTRVLQPVKSTNMAIQLIQREPDGVITFDMAKGAVIKRTVDSDKTVINPVGNNTSMRSTSYLLERIFTESADISDIPTNNAKN